MEHKAHDSSAPIFDLRNDLIPELQRLTQSKSKFSSPGLLIVTVILFFGVQIISFKWQDILILIGVLFVHELGHLSAMRLFKYSDVKMFFIPFIGAAVSGKKQEDSAVRSCIVSLMGPLPGMLLGVILYFLFTATNHYYVFKTAQVMLLLNAFNFLPIMPLDGGKYVDVLFINRRYFRLCFALFGAGLFIFLAISAKDVLLGLIGAFSVLSAASSFKLHGISMELKSAGVSATSVNELIENDNLLNLVVGKLSEKYPKLFSPRLVYNSIFNHLTVIVDTIKLAPAKFVSKSMLLTAYLALVFSAFTVTSFFMAMDYREKVRMETKDGNQQVYSERYLYGKKVSECPINDASFYDGKGFAFSPGPGSISSIFHFSNGYRTGEWHRVSETGDVLEKRTYSNGQLVSVSLKEEGQWKTLSFDELSWMRKCAEEIRRISQPLKSNHLYF